MGYQAVSIQMIWTTGHCKIQRLSGISIHPPRELNWQPIAAGEKRPMINLTFR